MRQDKGQGFCSIVQPWSLCHQENPLYGTFCCIKSFHSYFNSTFCLGWTGRSCGKPNRADSDLTTTAQINSNMTSYNLSNQCHFCPSRPRVQRPTNRCLNQVKKMKNLIGSYRGRDPCVWDGQWCNGCHMYGSQQQDNDGRCVDLWILLILQEFISPKNHVWVGL